MAFEYFALIRLIRYKFGTQDDFAKVLGIGRVSLSQRLNNKLEFTQAEIVRAAEILDIPKKSIPEYFFKEKVQKSEQNKEET